MSLRIAILRILAARPDGTVPLATVRSELALLMSVSGQRQRGQTTGHRMPSPPDLFAGGLVAKIGDAWQISAAGRAYLDALGESLVAHATAPTSDIIDSASNAADAQALDRVQRPLTIIAGQRSKPEDAAGPNQIQLPSVRVFQRRTAIASRRRQR